MRPSQKVDKPQNIGKTIARVITYLASTKLLVAFVLIFVLFSSMASIIGNAMLKPVINNYIVPLIGQEEVDYRGLIGMLSIMVVVYLLGVICTYAYQRIMMKVSNVTLNKIREDLFNKMQDLPIEYFDTHTHGELMSRFSGDVDTIRETLGQGFTQLVSSAITVSGTFFMMLYLSPSLTVIVIVMIFIMLMVIKFCGSRSRKYFRKQQAAMGEVNGYVEEMIEGLKVIKVFNHEEKAKEDFEVINDKYKNAATQANTFASIVMPIMGNLAYMTYAITAAVGAYQVIIGLLDIGSIASYLQYTRTFSMPITQISQQFNALLAALAGAERIFNVIDTPKEADDGLVELVNAEVSENQEISESSTPTNKWAWKVINSDKRCSYVLVKGDVRFKDVVFGYSPQKTILKGISLFAKPGQKIAFVGSTGAGKTTITNLINRFYEIDCGEITYDGINIKKIKKDDLRKSLAMVLQDTHLFTGTVKENIIYGKLDATDEEVIAAAKLANAHSFIKHLPQGYDTLLTSDGANLSQGQRQLLSIARAAIANPPVLILDEATSSIDTRTEALIEKGMDKLMEGRTVFVIAHRLSTVRNAKAIMVLENGEIIERGNHDELIRAKGRYYALYTGQFELD